MQRLLVILLTGAALFDTVRSQSEYTVIPITPGAAKAISDSGHVLGAEAGTGRLFVWRDGAIQYFTAPSGFNIFANDINNLGQVAGSYRLDAAGTYRAFKWEDGVFTNLGTFGIYTKLYGGAVNNNGVIAGDATAPNLTWTSFLWDNGTFTPILGGTPLEIWGINDSLHLVGETGGGGDGYIYRNGVLTPLGSLPVDSTSYPQAINASDAVAGFTGSVYRRAFLWKEGTMTALNTVNANQSYAFDINDSDDVVGYIAMTPGFTDLHGFLWKDGQAIDLNDRIDPAEGWTITQAWGISNRGEIAATASRDGQSHAVLLTNRPTIIRPVVDERWIVGRPDTIRWKSDPPRNYEIRFSRDGGSNFSLLTTVPDTESMHVWYPPDSLSTSSECLIRLTDALDSSVSFQSGKFTLRAYDLVRPFPDSSWEVFRPASHGWAFDNDSVQTLWPRSWWEPRFDYGGGTDPYTAEVYPPGIFQQCQFIDGVRSCPADSDFVDWISWVGTFGVDACYTRSFLSGNPDGYRHHATSWWKRYGEPYGGACYGLAVSSLLAFHYSDWLHANYALPPFDALLTVGMDANVRQLIAHFYSYQYGVDQWSFDQAGASKPPVQTLQELKAKLLTDDPADDAILNLLDQGSTPGGHSVLPYRVVSDPGNPALVRIYVYDSNNPGSPDAFVVVDTSANTWAPMLPGLGFTGGSKGLFLDLSVGNFQHTPILREPSTGALPAQAPVSAVPALYVLTDDGTEAMIISPGGDSVGYADGLVIDNSPTLHALVPKTGRTHPPVGYRLLDGGYDVSLTKFSGSTSNLTVVYPDAIYEYERDAALQDEVDRFTVASGLGVVNTDTTEKQIHLRAVSVGDSTEIRFDILNTGLFGGDSLFLKADDTVSVQLANHGAEKAFDLSVERISGAGVEHFEYPAVALPENSTGRIVVDEESLETIDLVIDIGHDGTIDDTVSYANQVTDVGGETGSSMPDQFTLAQNYPNPFNGETLIEYGLPAGGHVKLAVYDALGRKVAMLVDEYRPAGFGRARWDASGAPSGVYYARMHSGSFTTTVPMLLMR